MITITIHLNRKGCTARAALHTLEKYLGMCNVMLASADQLTAHFSAYALDNASVQAALFWAAGDFVQDGHILDVTDGNRVQRVTHRAPETAGV